MLLLGVVVVLYLGFKSYTFYRQNNDPNVEVWCLVAYHYSPIGDDAHS